MMWFMRTLNRKSEKTSQLPSDPMITGAKFTELKEKLDYLKTKARPQTAVEVARLAEMGDFSENYAYQAAKGRLRGINNNILKLEHQLNRAEIIAPKNDDRVQVGHTVVIECDGKEKTYQILGSSETDPTRGIISQNSPIGSALLNKKIGETVKIQLANKEVEYKIISIK
ncbi:MAG: GreA/GreB family elongation factor [Candidatus Magasanikbacteria bacterium]|nr:GreA/GreB family elongation factor [Candidatus Magasanikbacteria bacterium]